MKPQSLKHVTDVQVHTLIGNTVTIAYDGSRNQDRMAASISVFYERDEIFTATKEVHGKPESSTRAEIYGVVMCLDYVRRLQELGLNVKTVILYGDNQTSLRTINDADDLILKQNIDLFLEIQHLKKEMKCEVS